MSVRRARGWSPTRRRRGVALLVAVAALALVGALAVTLNAAAWRAQRAAERARRARRAGDAAEAALAEWAAALATDASAVAGDGVGVERALEARVAVGDQPAVTVTIATLAGGARLLVVEARAGDERRVLGARRRVALLLVPDSIRDGARDSLPDGGVVRPVLRPAPERAFTDLP